MSRAEKFSLCFALFCFYIMFGVFFGWMLDDVLGLVPIGEHDVAEYFAIILFWPLFVIKFLVIGIWVLLSTAASMLIGN